VLWGYNIINAVDLFRWDADLDLFNKILMGDLSEETYYEQAIMLSNLTLMFTKLQAVQEAGGRSGCLCVCLLRVV
jgi:hypothetical protein